MSRTIGSYAEEYLHEITSGARGQSRVKLHIRDVDRMTGGFHPGKLVIVAGRPSCGKSVLGLVNIAYRAAVAGARTDIISYEMSRQEIMDRFVAHDTGIETTLIRDGGLSRELRRMVEQSVSRIAKLPISIDEFSTMTVEDIAKSTGDTDLLMVDYLQLIPPTKNEASGNRTHELEHITKSMKRLAGARHIPIILLSQLNRSSDREGRPPQLFDLRDSGAIEQDADIVIFIYNNKLIVAKQRNGPTGSAPAFLDKRRMMFCDSEREDPVVLTEAMFNSIGGV